jgi:hypothetical protein
MEREVLSIVLGRDDLSFDKPRPQAQVYIPSRTHPDAPKERPQGPQRRIIRHRPAGRLYRRLAAGQHPSAEAAPEKPAPAEPALAAASTGKGGKRAGKQG